MHELATQPGIMMRLKEATRTHHVAVEQKLDLLNRVRTVHDYGKLLARLYGFYAPVEARMDGVAGAVAGLDLDARRKTPLLREDLLALGWNPGSLASIALCPQLPDLRGATQALGCLYVLEGATLGGLIIGRHLKPRLDVDFLRCGRFFASYGPEIGAMWKKFGQAVESYAATQPGVQDALLDCACATFAAFGRWLQAEGDLFERN